MISTQRIAKFAGAAPLMTVQLTDNTGVAPVKEVPPTKVMSPWSQVSLSGEGLEE